VAGGYFSTSGSLIGPILSGHNSLVLGVGAPGIARGWNFVPWLPRQNEQFLIGWGGASGSWESWTMVIA
jgi:hypothetical protein